VDACYVGVGSSVALPTLAQAATPTPIAVGPPEYPYLSDISPRVSSALARRVAIAQTSSLRSAIATRSIGLLAGHSSR
jgi:hypothetical protein